MKQEYRERKSALEFWRYLQEKRPTALHNYRQAKRVMKYCINTKKLINESFLIRILHSWRCLIDFTMMGMCIRHRKWPAQIAMDFYWTDKSRYLALEEMIEELRCEYGF